MLPSSISLASLANLPAAAHALRRAIAASACTVVAFEGEMGAGKTTLIAALCRELGVADAVSSPTFGLINEYRGADQAPIYHFDFYRIDSVDEALRMGAADYFDSGYLCLVEWPSRVTPLLPLPHLHLNMRVEAKESRVVELEIIN